MGKIIHKKDIENLSEKEQLEFYKQRFKYQHCELDGCSSELYGDWVIYNDTPYCDSCFEWLRNEEKENYEREIKKLQKELDKVKEEYQKF